MRGQASDLTADGMKAGVKESAFFILFLSTGVLTRPFVQTEVSDRSCRALSIPLIRFAQLQIREAIRLKKKILLMHEAGIAAPYDCPRSLTFRCCRSEVCPL